MKKKIEILLIMGLMMILTSLIIAKSSIDGMIVYFPVTNSTLFNIMLIANGILLVFGFSLWRLLGIKEYKDVKKIRNIVEQHYKTNLPDINVMYTNYAFMSEYGGMNIGGRGFGYDEEITDRKTGKRITFPPYTIVLPTKKSIRNFLLDEYSILKNIYNDSRLNDEKKKAYGKYTMTRIMHYTSLYKNFEIYSYLTKGHEIGHSLGRRYGLYLDENEGVAEACGIVIALLGIKNKRLPLGETLEKLTNEIDHWKTLPETDNHRMGFDKVLGHDFYLPRDIDESVMNDLIVKLDEKISLVIEKNKK